MAGEDPEEEAEEANTEDEKCYEAAEVLFFDNHDLYIMQEYLFIFIVFIYSMHL